MPQGPQGPQGFQGPQAAMAVTSKQNHRSFHEIGGRTKRLCLKMVCWCLFAPIHSFWKDMNMRFEKPDKIRLPIYKKKRESHLKATLVLISRFDDLLQSSSCWYMLAGVARVRWWSIDQIQLRNPPKTGPLGGYNSPASSSFQLNDPSAFQNRKHRQPSWGLSLVVEPVSID